MKDRDVELYRNASHISLIPGPQQNARDGPTAASGHHVVSSKAFKRLVSDTATLFTANKTKRYKETPALRHLN